MRAADAAVANGLLSRRHADYAVAIGENVNPSRRDFTIASVGSGPDVVGALLEMDFTLAYFFG